MYSRVNPKLRTLLEACRRNTSVYSNTRETCMIRLIRTTLDGSRSASRVNLDWKPRHATPEKGGSQEMDTLRSLSSSQNRAISSPTGSWSSRMPTKAEGIPRLHLRQNCKTRESVQLEDSSTIVVCPIENRLLAILCCREGTRERREGTSQIGAAISVCIQIRARRRSASLNRHIAKHGRIPGVKAMGGHLYWHECHVETILCD
jgi:hypothetical protein